MSDGPTITPGESLLVAAPVAWREACLSMPAMRAFKRLGADLRVLCPATQTPLWSASGFGKVTGYPERASVRAIAALLEKGGTALAWEAGDAAEAIAKAGIPRRLGPPAKGLDKRLTERITVIEKPGPIQHRVRFYLDIAEMLGVEAMVAENFAPLILGVPRAVDRVLLVPDSDLGSHFEWLPERWEMLAGEGRHERQARCGAGQRGDGGGRRAAATSRAGGSGVTRLVHRRGWQRASSGRACGYDMSRTFRSRRAGVDASAGPSAWNRTAKGRVLSLFREQVPDGSALPE
jgi:hypothetical protein